MKGSFLLFVVFLVLKLTGAIDWSWWLVTIPLWIGVAWLLLTTVFIGVLAFIIGILDAIFGGK